MTVLALPRAGRRATALGIVGFAGALALASQVAIPVPGTPVPITLQPLVVVLAGLWLGPLAGAASMVLYLALGAMGMPVFAPMGAPGLARLVGPTGGYLLAWPLAAWLAGRIGHGGAYVRRALGASAGILAIYVGGVAQLTVLTGSLTSAALMGLVPFVVLDVVKAHLAALLAPGRAPARPAA
jgi:biotin transport system substrate-specific component